MAILGPFDFSGGYCPGYDFDVLPQNKGYATIMNGCRFRGGAIRPRWGTIQMNTVALGTPSNVLGLTFWKDTANSVLAGVATSGSKLYTADATAYNPVSSGAIVWTDRTGAIAASSLSGLTTFDSLNNILVGSANSASSGVPFKVTAYNANGAALGGTPPSADIAKQVNNFMFLSRNLSSTTTQSKVYWSNVNDPETWTAANVLDFNKNDGEPIMALGSIGTDLYIFKKTSIGRLGTTTLTVSGAVTLGPLSTVIKGVGCCGPRALDNLPNGNIVFWGYDGNFYEFDGSTVINLSRNKYPGVNVYDQSFYTTTGYPRLGLSFMTNDVNASVKVCRGINEVYVSCTSTSFQNFGFQTMIYDFEQGIWQGSCQQATGSNSYIGGFCFATIPVDPVTLIQNLESTEILVFGDSLGRVMVCGDQGHPYPRAGAPSGNTVGFNIGTTIQLIDKDGPFIARSLCIETSKTQTASGTQASLASLSVFVDFDADTITSSLVYSATVGVPLPARIVIPLSFTQDTVGTNIFPTFLTVVFTGTGQGSCVSRVQPEILRLGKFWLSDEIIR